MKTRILLVCCFLLAASVLAKASLLSVNNPQTTDPPPKVSISSAEANTTYSNPNEAAESFMVTYDKRPEVTLSEATFDAQERVFTLSISFNEQVSGFSAADITVSNGSISALQTADSLFFLATVTPAGDGEIQLSVAENVAFDLAGNGNLASEALSLAYDGILPSVTITTELPSLTNQSSIVVDLTFSEQLSGLSKYDFQLSNGTVTSFISGTPVYLKTIGPDINRVDNYISSPVNLSFDQNGFIYVVARKANRIIIFDRNFHLVSTIGDGSTGKGKYQFGFLSDVFIDQKGNVYVVDSGNNRVQLYDKQRNYIATIGTGEEGSANEQLNNPTAVAVDARGFIYVADSGNKRVQVFDSERNYVHTLGTTSTPGAENNQFKGSVSVEISNDDRVFVADTYNHRIQVFNSNWVYQQTLGISGVPGSTNNQFNYPRDISFDSKGNFYVVDVLNQRIQKFDTDLNYLKSIPHTAGGFPFGLAIDESGSMYISNLRQINVLDVDGKLVSTLGSNGSGDGNYEFYSPTDIEIGAQNQIYIGDGVNDRIQIYDKNFTYLKSLNGISSDSQFDGVDNLAVDSKDNLYIPQTIEKLVLVYDSALKYKTTIHTDISPSNIEIGPNDNIYVLDKNDNILKIYDKTFQHKTSISPELIGEIQNPYVKDIAVDIEGKVYLLCGSSIQMFDINGNLLSILHFNDVNGSYFLQKPNTVAVDVLGNIFISDFFNHDIKVFNAELEYLYTIGNGQGINSDQFSNPQGMAINENGHIYVADQDNNRIQVFSPPLKYQMEITPAADGEVVVELPANATTDLMGNGNEAARFSILYDGSGPLANFSSADSLSRQPDVEVEINFDEPVSGLQASSFILTNATLENLQTIDSTHFTTQLRAEEEGYLSITLDLASVRDRAGNLNTQSAGLLLQYRIPRDTLAPSVEIRSTARDTVEGEFVVEMIFSEQVSGFDPTDIMLNNASILSLASTDSTLFSATVTPQEKGMISLSLGENVATDSAGNGNLASDIFSMYYDENYTLSLQVTTEVETEIGAFTATLYQRINGRYVTFTSQEISEGNAVQFAKLPEGEYTLGIQPNDVSLLTTYLGEKPLLNEAQAFYLDQNLTQSITLISASVEQTEGIASISGILLKDEETTSSGRIVNGTQQLSGTPLVNVKVYLLNADTEQIIASDVTDAEGRFSFSKLPQGEYLLVADHEGLPNDKQANRINIAPDTELVSLTAVVGSDVRITQVQEEKQITSVAEEVLSQIRYYPNPVEDQLTLEISAEWLNSTLTVHDKLGRMVMNTTLEVELCELDFSHLPKGVYVVLLLRDEMQLSFKISK